jgi:NADPH-dependent 7-cyano-7-deazaguanine reductase QueF
MRNTYELEVRAVCPVHDDLIDVYHATVISENLIEVEKIIAFFASRRHTQIFQEYLAQEAATALGARVELVGVHSGVKVTCIAP